MNENCAFFSNRASLLEKGFLCILKNRNHKDIYFVGKIVNKEQLEVIKVGSLVIIAISLEIIAWRMGSVVNLLKDLVMVSGNH